MDGVRLDTVGREPVLVIDDHKGRPFRYLYTLSGPDCVILTGLGGAGCYTLRRLPGVGWTCGCKDFVCRLKRKTGEGCKHSRSIPALLKLLAALGSEVTA